jgi:CheY-like chemotaxis protein
VLGDADQLQQVLMNLIGNARQAISGEGRPGTVRLRTSRSGSNRVQLQVSDDGPGIPPAILARIFDPFFTTKRAGDGTGLGLSIVLGVVREHGGQVQVSNLPGGGAAFTVDLPMAAEVSSGSGPHPSSGLERARPALPAAIGRSSRPHLARPLVTRASHRGSRVLVIEDEPTVARLITEVLEDEGMRVDVLLDGRDALARASRERYDLVICDMRMPGVDGQHFYRSLVETHSPLRERFLFVTGDVLAPQTQEFLQRNQIPYVAKPFRVEELMEKTSSLLDGQLARAGRAAAGKKGL